MMTFPTKTEELAYHGRNALALSVENGLATIEQIDDGPTARRFAVELRLMCEAMDVRPADTPAAVQERDETKRKLAIWSLRLDARIAELYDAIKDQEGNRYSRSLNAFNDLESSPKQAFLDEIGITRPLVHHYRLLVRHVDRLPELVDKVGAAHGGDMTRQDVLRAIRAEERLPEGVRLRSSESNEWYTPAQYTQAAYEVMDGIDLDPASHEAAAELVKAFAYFTIEQDGLAQPWFGNVWLNPPYNAGNQKSQIPAWIEKLFAELAAGRVTQACILLSLVHLRHKSVQRLISHFGYSLTFTDHYIRFISSNGVSDKPAPTGSVLIYVQSPKHSRCADTEDFAEFGLTVYL